MNQVNSKENFSKVIFLDIDGVLNYTLWYNDDRNPGNLNGEEGDLDPLCIERVNKLCKDNNAKIVISSDWRYSSGWKSRLDRAGLNWIIDCTPIIYRVHLSRGEEIDIWLEQHPEIVNYVIIDDRTDFTEEQKIHFIHINSYIGLTNEDVQLAKNILKH